MINELLHFIDHSPTAFGAVASIEELLKKEGIGIIQIDPYTLRVAFSSIDEDKIDSVYTSIYNVAENL